MTRKEQIGSAYRLTGDNASFYDGMMTYSTLPGKAICRAVWNMDREKNLRYIEQALSGVPENFAGKLLEVPVGTGVLTMPVYRDLPDAEITCLDYSEDMMNAAELMKRYPFSKLTALDYSETSVRKTKATNRKDIAAGRCSVVRGDVASLPFAPDSFDLATAFETVYFWPGLESCFAGVCRALRPGGTFLICNESDGTDETGLRFEKIIDGMKCYTAEELTAALRAAGFADVRTYRHPDKPWLTAVGRK